MYYVSRTVGDKIYVMDTSDGVEEGYDVTKLEAVIAKYKVDVFGLLLDASGAIKGVYTYNNPVVLGNTDKMFPYASRNIVGNGNEFNLQLLYLDYAKSLAVFGVDRPIAADAFVYMNPSDGIKVVSEGMLGGAIKPEIFVKLDIKIMTEFMSTYCQVLTAARNHYNFQKGQSFRGITVIDRDDYSLTLSGSIGKLKFMLTTWNLAPLDCVDSSYIVK